MFETPHVVSYRITSADSQYPNGVSEFSPRLTHKGTILAGTIQFNHGWTRINTDFLR
jgi:hypothetical protein